jgi:hypothetical protein
MTIFQIKKHNGKLFTCSACENDKFDTFIVKSSLPETVKNYQILKCVVRCSICDKSNMIYHTKIREIRLIEGNVFEVL